MEVRRWRGVVLVPVAAAALLANFGLAVKLGYGRQMESDAFYFLSLARSLAAGQGYVLRDGFWPEAPAMSRSPGWPFLVSLALRGAPGSAPDVVMRTLALLLNVLAAVLVAVLTGRLFRSRAVALLAGLGYALYPVALYHAYEGLSEVLFVVLLLGATLLFMAAGRRAWWGYLVLGLATLVRPNLLPWVLFVGLGAVWRCLRERRLPARAQVAAAALAVVLFLLPSLLWAERNRRACGRFPVLSTLCGQTFYGGNNAVVADTLEWWGYWVFPDSIPGETPMRILAAEKSEAEVDAYYIRKGRQYLRQHWFALPRLWLGKLVRAWVPVPWKPSWAAYAVSAYRWVLYVLALLGIGMAWPGLHPAYRRMLGAIVGATLVTVLAFWGCARLVFPCDVLLLPLAALVLGRWLIAGLGRPAVG